MKFLTLFFIPLILACPPGVTLEDFILPLNDVLVAKIDNSGISKINAPVIKAGGIQSYKMVFKNLSDFAQNSFNNINLGNIQNYRGNHFILSTSNILVLDTPAEDITAQAMNTERFIGEIIPGTTVLQKNEDGSFKVSKKLSVLGLSLPGGTTSNIKFSDYDFTTQQGELSFEDAQKLLLTSPRPDHLKKPARVIFSSVLNLSKYSNGLQITYEIYPVGNKSLILTNRIQSVIPKHFPFFVRWQAEALTKSFSEKDTLEFVQNFRNKFNE